MLYSSVLMCTVVLMIAYTAVRPDLLSPLGMSLWTMMSLVVVIIVTKTFSRAKLFDLLFLFSVAIIMVMHWAVTSDALLSLLMYLVVCCLLLFLGHTRFDSRKVLLIPIIGVVLQSILYFREMIFALIVQNELFAYSGFFLNSNTCSMFCAMAYISTYILLKTKWKYMLMILFIIGTFAGMSRGALLFIVAFHLFLFLMRRFKCQRLLIFSLPFMLFALAYVLIFTDTSDSISLFGKSGTTGRAMQITYLWEKYSINLFGYGREVISDETLYFFHYPPHNLFFFTLFGMGLLFLLCYLAYIVRIYGLLKSEMAKSALLAMQLYYFFEPVIPFEASLSFFLPNVIIIAMDKFLGEERTRNEYFFN